MLRLPRLAAALATVCVLALPLRAQTTFTVDTTLATHGQTLGAVTINPGVTVTGSSGVTVTAATSALNGTLLLPTGFTYNATGADLTLSGALNLTGGTLLADNLTVSTGGTVSVTAGTWNLGGTLNSTVGTYTQSGGTVTTGLSTRLHTASITGGTLSAGSVQLYGPTTVANATLTTSQLTRSNPAASLTLDGATLRPTTGTSAYFNGFTDTSVTLGSGGLTFDTNGFAVTVSAPLTGSGALTKIGNNTLTLSGNNTYTGGTTVAGGILAVTQPAALGTSTAPITVSSGGTFRVTPGMTIPNPITLTGGGGTIQTLGNRLTGRFSGNITGSAGDTLTISSSGITVLSGTNTYTGPTIVSTSGSGSGAQFATRASLYNSTPAAWTATNLTVNNGGSATFNVGGTGEFTATDLDLLGGLGTSTGGFRSGSRLGLDATNAPGAAFTYASAIANPNAGTNILGLDLRGGTITLAGNNTFTGPVNIHAGTLRLGSANAIPATTVMALLGSGGSTPTLFGQLDLNGYPLTVAGLSSGASGNTINLNGARLTINSASGTQSLSGAISGAGGLTLSGNATYLLSSPANTYTGGTLVANGARLRLVAEADTLGASGEALTLDAGTVTNNGAIVTRTVANPVTLAVGGGTFEVTSSGSPVLNVTWSGPISGAGSLAKTGTGQLTLSGTNTYTGATTVSAGTLTLTAAAALPAASTLTVASGATTLFPFGGAGDFTLGQISARLAGFQSGSTLGLDTAHASGAVTFSDSLTQPIGFLKSGSGQLTLAGNNTYTGATTVGGGTLGFATPAALPTGSALTVASGAAAVFGFGGPADFSPAQVFSIVSGATFQSGSSFGLDTTQATAPVVYSGALTQPLGFVKSGPGTLTLTGNNTYSGSTTISAGTLQLGDGGTSGSVASPTIVNHGTLAFNRSDAVGYSADISGSGSLVQLGTGTLTLIGANTHTGGTTISAGTLQIGQGSTLGSLNGNVVNQGTLAFNRSNNLTFSGNVTGAGGLTQLGTGTLTLTGTNTYSGPTTISAGTLQLGDGGTTGSLASTSIANSGTLTLNRSDAATLSAALSGPGALVKLGAGTLTLTGANTSTGLTTVSAGTLRAGAAATFSSASTLRLNNGSTADLNGFHQTVAGLDSFNATTGLLDSATVLLGGATLTHQGTVTHSWQGTLAGSGDVTKTGSGEWRWYGTNTFTGNLTLSAGTLGTYADNTLSPNATVILNGGLLDLGAKSQTVAGLAGTGGVFSNGGTLTVSQSADTTFSGVLSGSGGFTKAGPGTLTLTGTNTSTGPVTIAAGTLQLGNGGALSSAASSFVNSGSLVFNHSGNFLLYAPVSGPGSLTKLGSGTLTLLGPTSYTGATTISAGTFQIGPTGSFTGNVTNHATVAFDRSDALTYAGLISGSGSLTKLGAGTLTLTGDQTYTGSTTISAGTLQIGSGGTSGSLAISSIVNHATLVLNRSDDHTLPAAVSGPGSLVKLGAGTVTLTGAHTSTGTTTVSAGTLALGAANLLSPSATLRLVNNATVALNGFNQTIGTLDSFSPTTSQFETGTLALGGATLTNLNLSDSTWKGSLTGTGHYVFQGTAGTTWTGSNSFTGSLTVATGTLTAGAANTLSPNASVSVSSGATLALGGYSQAIAGLAGTGSVSLGSANLTTTPSADTTFAGVISGTGGLTKSGSGTLTLAGTHTYTGPTTISAGTLQLGDGATIDSSTSSFANSGSLVFNHTGSFFLSAPVTGTGSLTKLGNGTLTFSSTHTYSGGTTVTAGTLQIGNAGTTGSLAGDITNHGSLVFNRSDALTFPGAISGSGALTQLGAGTLTLSGNVTVSGTTTISAGTLQIGAGGTTGRLTGDIVNHATLAFNRSDALTYAGTVSGPGGLTQLGAGTLTLSGPNTYTGPTTVSAGTLALGAAQAIPAGTVLTVSTGATFDVAGHAPSVSNLSGAGSVSLGTGTLTTTQSADTTFAGVLSGPGALTKLGSGTLTLGGTHTYSGFTTISAGTLQLGNGGTVGSLAGDVLNHGTLALNRSDSVTLSAIVAGSLSGSGGLAQLGHGTLTITGNQTYTGPTTISAGTLQLGAGGTSGSLASASIANSGTLVLNRSDDVTLSAAVSGSGSLVKLGAGILTLTGANTFTGLTTVSAGTLRAGAAATFSSASTLRLNNGATLDLNGFNQTVAGLDSTNATTGLFDPGTVQLGGATLTQANLVTNIWAGSLSGTGHYVKSGAGNLFWRGANTFTGTLTLSAGTLFAESTATLSPNAIVVLAGGLLDLGTNSQLVAGLAGHSAVSLGNATLTVAQTGATTYSGVMVGSGSLAKSGPGTLTLSAAQTNSGPTTLTAGTLQLGDGGTTGSLGPGALTNTGTLAINRSDAPTLVSLVPGGMSGTGGLTQLGSGTLTITGQETYTGPTTISAGTLKIGNGGTTGSLATSAVTNHASLVFNRADALTFSAPLAGTGTLTQLGTGTLTLSGANTLTGTTTVSAGIFRAGSTGALSSGSTLFLNNGATLDLNGFNQTVANLDSYNAVTGFFDSGTVQLGGATLVNLTGVQNNWAGILTGTGTFEKRGTAPMVWSGANTFAGTLTVSAGTLATSAASALSPSATVTVATGATLALQGYAQTIAGLSGPGSVDLGSATLTTAQNTDTTFSGVLSGTGGLTKNGTGALTLTGNNTYTGATLVEAGTLTLGSGSTLATSGITRGASGSLAFNGGTLRASADTATFLTGFTSGTGVLGSGGLTLDTNSHTVSVSAPLSGTGHLTKSGTGTLTLSGAKYYSGNTTITAGTLALGAAESLPDSTQLTVAAGATYALNNLSDTLNGLSGAGTVSLGSGTLIVGAASADGTFSGVISGTGGLTKAGLGTQILTGANTYSGTTTINVGTLQIGNGGTTGSLASSSIVNHATLAVHRSDDVTLAGALSGAGTLAKFGNGTLTLTGTNTSTGPITLSAGTLQIGDGGTAGTLAASAITNHGTLAFNRADHLTSTAPISGPGSLVKLGSGTLTLSGAHTYTGATTITAGTLALGAHFTIPDTSPVTIAAGATLDLNGYSDTVGSFAGSGSIALRTGTLVSGGDHTSTTFAGVLSGPGALLKLGTGTLTLTGTNTYTAGTTVSAGTLQIGDGGTTGTLPGNITNQATLAFNRSDALTYSGVISGTGTLTQLGTGTLTLSGANTYSSNTTITAGTLRLGAANALPSGTPLALATGATLDLNNHTASVGKLDGSGNIVLGSANLTVAQSSSSAFTGGVSGTGGLTKSGSGTLTLAGTHTYSGATAITGGQLALTGSAPASAFSVDSSGTLSGTGTLGGLTVNAGGTVSPGASPGTLSAGNTTFNSGGSLKWEINNATGTAGTNWDLLSISGSLTVASTSGNPFALRLTSLLANNTAGQVINFNSAQNYSYTIATASSGITGFSASAFTLDTSGFANPLNGGSWSLAANGNNLNLNFTPSAIPEPSTYAAILGAVALLLAAHRRKNRSRSS